MVFSSLTFLFLFLPICLLCYFLAPKNCKNAVLFVLSLIFYAWGEPVYVVLMIFSTVLDYTCGRLTEKYRGTRLKRLGLFISVICNLSLLFFFKYTDFFITTINAVFKTNIPLLNLPLPIGISFYTFQTMSYTIDVYRGNAPMQKNIISFGAYVALFPQLIAGPIVRYKDIAEALNERTHSFEKFSKGVLRFTEGLGKKVLLANNAGLIFTTIVDSAPAENSIFAVPALSAWIGIIAYTFQIYFDFSGYSDMAIGLGHMLGFTFPENFDHPYISKSVTEFWRRWHMSLGTWFRDYVYIPLGGNRKGLLKQLRNIAIVWLLTGIWHGASFNFLFWGVYFGIFLIIEKMVLKRFADKIPNVFKHIYLMFVVIIGWVLFAFDDISIGVGYFLSMFGGGGVFATNEALYILLTNIPLLIICVLFSTTLPIRLRETVRNKVNENVYTAFEVIFIVAVFMVSVSYLVAGSYNPFLYFRF